MANLFGENWRKVAAKHRRDLCASFGKFPVGRSGKRPSVIAKFFTIERHLALRGRHLSTLGAKHPESFSALGLAEIFFELLQGATIGTTKNVGHLIRGDLVGPGHFGALAYCLNGDCS